MKIRIAVIMSIIAFVLTGCENEDQITDNTAVYEVTDITTENTITEASADEAENENEYTEVKENGSETADDTEAEVQETLDEAPMSRDEIIEAAFSENTTHRIIAKLKDGMYKILPDEKYNCYLYSGYYRSMATEEYYSEHCKEGISFEEYKQALTEQYGVDDEMLEEFNEYSIVYEMSTFNYDQYNANEPDYLNAGKRAFEYVTDKTESGESEILTNKLAAGKMVNITVIYGIDGDTVKLNAFFYNNENGTEHIADEVILSLSDTNNSLR